MCLQYASFWITSGTGTSNLKARGCTIVGPPERQSWGGTLMHVKDPGGNVVSFVQD